MEQLVVLLIVGAVALVKWVIQQRSSDTDEESSPQPPAIPGAAPRRPAANSEEERMRRFMEALGVPAGSLPPKIEREPLSRRTIVEQQRSPRALPPASPTIAPRPVAVPVPRLLRPKPHVFPRETEPQPAVWAEPAFAPIEKKIPPGFPAPVTDASSGVSISGAGTDIRALLRGRTLRDAMVLREILGPPRALLPSG